ncbi:two-component system response regulator PhoP [Kutzneria viridogrisea]|uniref:Two-component system OmpR family response regulator n=1 Tax=Kutzneria viridogrisea TaxID=47990 RepID=A0ABR6BK49_9PSEU|nr:response regulator transcription factor [Kutzneria albida]MBA8927278.1 two-component system OmpR family response regulator [Kutzneria viridogrisea]
MSTSSAQTRVLVVDDEPNIVNLLSTALKFVGFDVAAAVNGREALEQAVAYRPDVIVLDVMLPDLDGFGVCTRLRDAGIDAPVLFLTARDASEDKVHGLTLGGDDYVTKPFDLDELIARVNVLLKRGRTERQASNRLRVGAVELDQDTHEVWKDGELVRLSATEFQLLRYLMTNAGRVLSRAQILDQVWNYDFQGDSSIVETYIYYLRRKLDDQDNPLIHTVRGVGYLLRASAVQTSGGR